ncbi:MAG: hypothetical protein LBS36_11990, partial [Oscillospiraceae bacterium]|nr:hypothetical protein [Oscillospiraceae bacterium]
MEISEISLDYLFKLIKKNFILICLTGLAGLTAAFSVSYFAIPSVYVSTLKFYVSLPATESGENDLNNLNYAQKVVNTYVQILQTNQFNTTLQQRSGLNYSSKDIGDMISYSLLSNTEVFKIEVSAKDPNVAKQLADYIAEL